MASTVTIDLRHVARGLNIPLRQVQAVVGLLDEGNTVPFITRYRKDQTGGLDEEQIRQIQERLAKNRQLADRKQTILRSIEAQGKLSDELAKAILAAHTTKRLEDLYLPFKPKKQTLATAARTRGLEPLAREILEADPAAADLDARAADFVNSDKKVTSAADALLGAGHILAEQFSERADLRQRLREIFQRTGKFVCSQIGGEPQQQPEKPAEAAEEKPQLVQETNSPSTREATPQPSQEAMLETQAVSADPPEPGKEANAEKDAETTGGNRADVAGESPQAESTNEERPADTQDDSAAAEPVSEPPENAPTQPTAIAAADSDSSDQTAKESTPQPTPQPTAEPGRDATEAPTEPADANADKKAEPTSSTTAPADTRTAPVAAKPKPTPVNKKSTKKQVQLSKRELRKQRDQEKRIKAFQDYFDYSEELNKIPPHRVLAINRGERMKVLRVKVVVDLEAMHRVLDELLIAEGHPHADYLRGCARDALARLILPSLEREIRRELTDRAESHAVGVFARNLRNLLLQPPVQDRRVLAVDPGYRSGCKLVALDQFGNLLEQGIVYLVGRAERRQAGRKRVIELIRRFKLTVVVIGNGTACRESEDFFAELITTDLKDDDVAYVIVNEAGASVYSTSRIGREEFPDYDATLRGAISIGRRLLDPLSELVKIDAANIGVGLYQHDVKAKHLRSSLDDVVESCVNYVGVDVNSASPALLRYVSGLNQLTARRIYEHRLKNGPFRNREQLRDVAGLGEATFVQAAGFLKITSGDFPLDATWIHPESYEATGRVLAKVEHTPDDLRDKEGAAALAEHVGKIDLDAMSQELGVGSLTLKDILAQLVRPGRDPREDLPSPVFKRGILKIEDLSPGMELTGAVLNVVDFGSFVDIGMHDSGLVHVSQLADRFVRDPHDVVAVGDIVRVWVLEVDKERRRVSLTMIRPGSERPRRPRRDERSQSDDKPGTESGSDGQRQVRGRGSQHQRSSSSDKSRGTGRPRSSGGRRGPGKPGRGPRRGGDSKGQYRPKERAKPVVPISEDMKSGKAPMRTFGDLMQFFDKTTPSKSEAADAKKPKKKHRPEKKTPSEASPSQPEITEPSPPDSIPPADSSSKEPLPAESKPVEPTAAEPQETANPAIPDETQPADQSPETPPSETANGEEQDG